uniref:DNA-directed DNA polymerase n=1 Tax=viral metagenome TaxID=1070528 RepID=A0A6C0AZ01_9ZZZZ
MEHVFRLYDFNVYNRKEEKEKEKESSDEESTARTDTNQFIIQMFGINEKGESCSILAENFKPFFYVKVSEQWTQYTKSNFLQFLQKKMGKYYENSICECKFIKRKKLYGFDGGKEHKFIRLQFKNLQAFNKAKNLWYTSDRKLLENGLYYADTPIYLYESNIPPLLRFFHIKNISPSGWIALPKKKTIEVRMNKQTTCTYEFIIDYLSILPLNEKELRVPYKICSFDIEASSSHGDFPVPIKSYKKLATNIMDYIEKIPELTKEICKAALPSIIMKAFGFDTTNNLYMIDKVFPKKKPDENHISTLIQSWLTHPLEQKKISEEIKHQMTIEAMFENMNQEEDEEAIFDGYVKKYGTAKKIAKTHTIVDVICDKTYTREEKCIEINKSLSEHSFPPLEGDKVTFIGSTFLKCGEQEPYLNHCIVLNTCGEVAVDNCQVESYTTEEKVLLAWADLIQRENPDIIIGYNIFGFDYAFMFNRAKENGCLTEFLKLSKNKNEICGQDPFNPSVYKLEETTIQIASGQHDLKYIKMNGRVQIDLYNYFRREENLTSYKLDYVAGHFIGDYIKKIEYPNNTSSFNSLEDTSIIYTTNLAGLLEGSFVHMEEIGHSTDYYCDGAKFSVLSVNKEDKSFLVSGKITPDFSKKVRWCLAKDDVTPKDIFRMSNGSADDRAIIAKYCIQDCNLVHYLMNKVDVLTGFIEMAKICSVPISFLVLRGQGIKLTSYVAKKCREKRTLMPVIEKKDSDDGYEGAIVLDPKCDLYLDNPVACVDYASLYPSSMMSENLSHDSKVWTREYNLQDELICETGEKDAEENFIYDNLPEYEYVNITYDTFKYVRKTPSAAAEKIKSGYKICRFAQFPNNARAIMPSILEELLQARKSTRKLIPQEKDEFMKNVLDKRQLGYKVTANSLYGQCGAKTSTFYDKDIAASTTATGRLLLTYAKRMIEETYGNRICDTAKYGPVLTKAEYIYGDSVANYTPVYLRVYGDKIDICTIEELATKYGNKLWVKCKEEGKQEKEFCELQDVETWTEKGWTKLHRVIRHELASHKKMVRVITNTGLVDVTDDHSLLTIDGNDISPKDVKVGNELLHNELPKDACSTLFQGSINMNHTIQREEQHLEVAKYCAYAQSKGFVIKFEKDASLSFYDKEGRYPFTRKCQVHNKNKIINMHEIEYQGYVYDLTTKNHHFAAGIGNMIVHNTDSVFFTFNLHTPEGQPIKGKEALEITIELAQEAGHLASSFLKAPHDLEYEKTFMPFCLLSKKRYVGMLYEHDPDKCKRKEMGIVLKRRDNAPIVKDIYGGIIDILMKQQDIKKAMEFLKSCLKNIVEEKYPMDKLIITKSLRSGYKNPQQIAHKVLSDRMTARDPGNKPTSGDRIPFVYIHNTNKKALQGEKIETPTYIKENKMKIDYSFYITNQIMKPVQQVFALVLEKIWDMQNKKSKISKFRKDVETLQKNTSPEKLEDKLEQMRNKEIKALLFDEFLRNTNNQKQGNQSLTSFFTKM